MKKRKITIKLSCGSEIQRKMITDLLLGMLKAWEYRHKKNSWVMIEDDLKELK